MAEITKNPHDRTTTHDHEINPQVSHERRDVNVFQITAFGIGLLLGCIVVVFAMWAMFDFLFSREDTKNAHESRRVDDEANGRSCRPSRGCRPQPKR